MLGLDSPEMSGPECGAPAATKSLKRMLPKGTRVKLLSDTTQRAVDRYGRLLRYVEKKSNGSDMPRLQIKRGWHLETLLTSTRSHWSARIVALVGSASRRT